MKYGLLLSVLLLFILGCNDSSSKKEESIGIWFGETTYIQEWNLETYTVEGELAEMAAIVTPDGRFFYTSPSSFETVAADIIFDGNDFSSEDAAWYKPNALEMVRPLVVTLHNGVLTGEFGGGFVNFNASPLASRDVHADLNLIAGNYYASNDISLAIDSDGILTGSDSDGCVYSGSVNTINPNFPIYDVVLKREGCTTTVDLEGDYYGVAAYGVFPFDNNDLPGLILITEGPGGPEGPKLWKFGRFLLKG